jgi:beta-lactamase regulating signal transducer with metallopeptidase domain
MTDARRVFALWAALAVAGLGVVLTALLVAVSRVDVAPPTVAQLIAACRSWVLPDLAAASLAVLGLGSVGVAVLALTLRSALRQLRATHRFERGLAVIGTLPDEPRVRLVDEAAPQAFCVGLLRPRVYLSRGAAELLTGEERLAVLAHEFHHARRRDPLRLLVTRSVGAGLFFLPALARLARRHAALTELAADEAAEEVDGGRRSLAAAMLAFDAHPDPAAVAIAPERVDRLLGEHLSMRLPVLLIGAAAAALAAIGAVAIRVTQATEQASISLPAVLAQMCMLAMAALPLLLGAGCVLGGRRMARGHVGTGTG